ncbi:hypothetical protein [Carnobacterium maltaromaticum]|uniref:hypothetical protein n=1 Tax=Carnobacterium maltaromaticum TaxID=2751 RepID=UPI0039AFDC77
MKRISGVTLAILVLLFIPVSAKAAEYSNLGPGNIKKETVFYSNLGPEKIESKKIEEQEKVGTIEIKLNDNSILKLDKKYTEGTEYSTVDRNVSTRALTDFKTITLARNNSNFPTETYYSQYNNSVKCWYAGNLSLRTISYSNGRYVATYSGILVMQNW